MFYIFSTRLHNPAIIALISKMFKSTRIESVQITVSPARRCLPLCITENFALPFHCQRKVTTVWCNGKNENRPRKLNYYHQYKGVFGKNTVNVLLNMKFYESQCTSRTLQALFKAFSANSETSGNKTNLKTDISSI